MATDAGTKAEANHLPLPRGEGMPYGHSVSREDVEEANQFF